MPRFFISKNNTNAKKEEKEEEKMRNIITFALAVVIGAGACWADECPTLSFPEATMIGSKYSSLDSIFCANNCTTSISHNDIDKIPEQWDGNFRLIDNSDKKFAEGLYANSSGWKKLYGDCCMVVFIECPCFNGFSLRLFYFIDGIDTLLFIIDKYIDMPCNTDDERKKYFQSLIESINKKAGFESQKKDKYSEVLGQRIWWGSTAIWAGKSMHACLTIGSINSDSHFTIVGNSLWQRYLKKSKNLYDEKIEKQRKKASSAAKDF